jgi:asparagine synthase (glutamine-hydrolysing)
MRGDAVGLAEARASWAERIQPFVRNPHLGDPDLFMRDAAFRGHLYLDACRFASYLTRPWHEPFVEQAHCADLLRNRMLNELRQEVVPVILHEDDANAMYCSIENRSPFLDRALVEFANRIPTRHLVRDGRAKAVLRDAVRGLVPDEALTNPRKVGFNAPVRSFLDTADPAVRQWVLADSPIYEYVRRESVEELIDTPALSNSESKFLFSFVSGKTFLERFAA